MSFKRQPLLNLDVEEQLKQEFHPLWLSGLSGKEIAEKLQFGVKGTIYEKVKPNYVYFYRLKWQKQHLKNVKQNPLDFPARKKPAFAIGEHRYNVSPDDLKLITAKEFLELIAEKFPYDTEYSRKAKSFLAILFFTPLRSSEIYERSIYDFEITETKIIIKLLRKKKGHKAGDKSEPVTIPRAFPLMGEVVEWLEGEEWKNDKNNLNRPWNITSATARNYVREIIPDGYPHFFRFRFLTAGANDPKTSLAELKAKSRLTLPALEHYIMAPAKLEADFDKRELERLRDEGVIE